MPLSFPQQRGKIRFCRLQNLPHGGDSPTGAQQLSPRLNRLVFGPYVMSVKNRRTAFDWLSKDEAVVDAYIADPLCGFSFRCAAYRDLFEGLDEVSSKNRSDAFRMFRFTFLPVTPILSGISAEGRAGYAITL